MHAHVVDLHPAWLTLNFIPIDFSSCLFYIVFREIFRFNTLENAPISTFSFEINKESALSFVWVFSFPFFFKLFQSCIFILFLNYLNGILRASSHSVIRAFFHGLSINYIAVVICHVNRFTIKKILVLWGSCAWMW